MMQSNLSGVSTRMGSPALAGDGLRSFGASAVKGFASVTKLAVKNKEERPQTPEELLAQRVPAKGAC